MKTKTGLSDYTDPELLIPYCCLLDHVKHIRRLIPIGDTLVYIETRMQYTLLYMLHDRIRIA